MDPRHTFRVPRSFLFSPLASLSSLPSSPTTTTHHHPPPLLAQSNPSCIAQSVFDNVSSIPTRFPLCRTFLLSGEEYHHPLSFRAAVFPPLSILIDRACFPSLSPFYFTFPHLAASFTLFLSHAHFLLLLLFPPYPSCLTTKEQQTRPLSQVTKERDIPRTIPCHYHHPS